MTRSGFRRRQGCNCPAAKRAFPAFPRKTPQEILTAHGLRAGEAQILDRAHGVTVTPWRRAA